MDFLAIEISRRRIRFWRTCSLTGAVLPVHPLRQRTEELARKLVELKPAISSGAHAGAGEKKLGALYASPAYQECRQEYERAREIDEQRCALPMDTRPSWTSLTTTATWMVTARLGSYDDALASHRARWCCGKSRYRGSERPEGGVVGGSSTDRIESCSTKKAICAAR